MAKKWTVLIYKKAHATMEVIIPDDAGKHQAELKAREQLESELAEIKKDKNISYPENGFWYIDGFINIKDV